MQLIVIASIHQPSTSTFNLFDKVLLLSGGKSQFFGPVSDVNSYYESLGYQLPLHTNPAEFILELVNIDFASDREAAAQRLLSMGQAWSDSQQNATLASDIADISARPPARVDEEHEATRKPNLASLVITLLHRSFVKSYRDVVAYGIRLAMYLGRLKTQMRRCLGD